MKTRSECLLFTNTFVICKAPAQHIALHCLLRHTLKHWSSLSFRLLSLLMWM